MRIYIIAESEWRARSWAMSERIAADDRVYLASPAGAEGRRIFEGDRLILVGAWGHDGVRTKIAEVMRLNAALSGVRLEIEVVA